MGAGLLARNAVAAGLHTKPWVKTSLSPGSQVVGEYLQATGPAGGPRRARLQPHRLRLHDLHRQFRSAAARYFEGHQRQRHRGRGRDLGQPQLRGPGQPGREGQLPCLAAAGRRLCAGRLARHRPFDRTARPGQGRPRLSARHLALAGGGRQPAQEGHHQGDLRRALWQRVRGRRQLAHHRGRRVQDLPLEHGLDLCAEPALLRGHDQAAGADPERRPTPASSACSSIPSPPTTSRRPARSRPRRRPGATCSSIRCGRRTSTNTARAAAITKS